MKIITQISDYLNMTPEQIKKNKTVKMLVRKYVAGEIETTRELFHLLAPYIKNLREE